MMYTLSAGIVGLVPSPTGDGLGPDASSWLGGLGLSGPDPLSDGDDTFLAFRWRPEHPRRPGDWASSAMGPLWGLLRGQGLRKQGHGAIASLPPGPSCPLVLLELISFQQHLGSRCLSDGTFAGTANQHCCLKRDHFSCRNHGPADQKTHLQAKSPGLLGIS